MTLNQHKNPDIIINEVLMTRAAFEGAILLVEGETDQRSSIGRVEHSACQIIDTEGKPHLVSSIIHINGPPMSGVLGVVDDDADSLIGMPANPNIVRTDARDLEAILIRSDATRLLVAQYGSISRTQSLLRSGRDAVSDIPNACIPHGRLRILARQLDIGVNFGRIRIAKYLATNLTLDTSELLRDAAPLFGATTDQLRENLSRIPKDWDPWYVAQGHDLVSATCHALNRGFLGRANVGPEVVVSMLSACLPQSQWESSGIYRQIREWEEDIGLRVLI